MRIQPSIITLMLALGITPAFHATPASAQVAIGVSVRVAPPPLPDYDQPPLPGSGYLWTPGYWAWGDADYYWVPGAWVQPPSVGVLWTPAWWGWNDGVYAFHAGYWGPHVGFYGGLNIGFGYNGGGFFGGRWENGAFAYNRAVANIGETRVTNVYNETVIHNTNVTRISFNGGPGGVNARPTPEQEAAARERHIEATSAQVQQQHMAATNPGLKASENHGRPTIAATSEPGRFEGNGVVAAKGAPPAQENAAAKAKQEPNQADAAKAKQETNQADAAKARQEANQANAAKARQEANQADAAKARQETNQANAHAPSIAQNTAAPHGPVIAHAPVGQPPGQAAAGQQPAAPHPQPPAQHPGNKPEDPRAD